MARSLDQASNDTNDTSTDSDSDNSTDTSSTSRTTNDDNGTPTADRTQAPGTPGSGGYTPGPTPEPDDSSDSDDSNNDDSSGAPPTADDDTAPGTPGSGGQTAGPSTGSDQSDTQPNDQSETATDASGSDTTTSPPTADEDAAPGTPGSGGQSAGPTSAPSTNTSRRDSDSPSTINDTPARGGNTGSPTSGAGFTGSGDPPGGASEPNPSDLEFDDNTIDRDPGDGPGTSMAEIGLATRLEGVLRDQYGDRDFDFAAAGDDVVARFETEGGKTQYVPIALSEDATGAENAAVSLQRQQEREELSRVQETYSDVGQAIQEQARNAAIIEAAEAQREQRSQGQEDIATGNLGDTQEIRDERAAEQVSEQFGVPVTDEDVTVREGEDGEQEVALTDEAQRAAALTSSAEFLRRDAEIERDDGGFSINLPGDSDALEEALEQKVETGEAFGGETSVNVLGQTITVEQDLEAIGDAVGDVVGDAVDFADRANLLSNQPAGQEGENASQNVLQADSTVEASEDFTLQAIEQAGSALGEIPSELLEVGEAATDPLAYQAAGEAGMMGARQFGDIAVTTGESGEDTVAGPLASMPRLNVEGITSTAQGAYETGERINELAQENPEAAVPVASSVLGGAALGAGSYAAAPAAVSRLASVSPTAARAATVALDPVRSSARAGASAARRADIPDSDSLRVQQFLDDTRGQARLTGQGQQRDVDGETDGDVDADDSELGVPDDDPFRNSDSRLYDPSRTFDEANDPSVDVDPTDRSGEALDDIQGGISGQGNPQAAPGTDFTWDASPSSRSVRQEAESMNVGDTRDALEPTAESTALDTALDTELGVTSMAALTSSAVTEDVLLGEDAAESEVTVDEEMATEVGAGADTDQNAFSTADSDAGVTDFESTATETEVSVTETVGETEIASVTETTPVTVEEPVTGTEPESTTPPADTSITGRAGSDGVPPRATETVIPDDEGGEDELDEMGNLSAFSEDDFDTGLADVDELEERAVDIENQLSDI